MTRQEKIELGRLLDRHRILQIYYFERNDVYLIRHLNAQDEEVPEEIEGKILD